MSDKIYKKCKYCTSTNIEKKIYFPVEGNLSSDIHNAPIIKPTTNMIDFTYYCLDCKQKWNNKVSHKNYAHYMDIESWRRKYKKLKND